MKTYKELADHIAKYAIQTGRTKGNAPVKRVKNSAREFIRYADGEGSAIQGWMNKKFMFVMYPDNTLTVHRMPDMCPSEQGFMYHAVGLYYGSRSIKGQSQYVVEAAYQPYQAGKRMCYVAFDGQKFAPGGVCTNPREFVGVRVDKSATATARGKLKAFADMYCLWFTPEKPAEATHRRIFDHPDEALENEEDWEDLCIYLRLMSYQKYVQYKWRSSPQFNPEWYEPRKHIPLLRDRLTVRERYKTGLYSYTVGG